MTMSADAKEQRIGFAGIGVMGAAIAGRLLDAGCDVTIWNRSPDRLEPLLAKGAKAAATPADLAGRCDVLLLCLLDAAVVEAVVLGRDGIAETRLPLTVVDHSSISPKETVRIQNAFARQTGGHWIDAPVSGGTAAAERGALTIMMGGEAEHIDAVSPLLSVYAAHLAHMGPVGAGQLTKLCNQIIVGTTMASIAEAMRFAADVGLDPAGIPDALAGGMADSLPFRLLAPRMLSPPPVPIGHIESMLKDLESASRCARESGATLPVLTAATALFRSAAEEGLAREEPSALFRFLDRDSRRSVNPIEGETA